MAPLEKELILACMVSEVSACPADTYLLREVELPTKIPGALEKSEARLPDQYLRKWLPLYCWTDNKRAARG